MCIRDRIYAYLSKGYADAVAAHETSILQFMSDFGIEYRILDEPLQVVGPVSYTHLVPVFCALCHCVYLCVRHGHVSLAVSRSKKDLRPDGMQVFFVQGRGAGVTTLS